jgi:hypothetical protein
MASNEHKPVARRTGASTSGGSDFWQYVPDPSRTVIYVLIAVAAVTTTEWAPQIAGEIEESMLQRRLRDFRVQLDLEHDQWRKKNPQHAQWVEQQWAQSKRQAEQDAEAEFQLARPSNPMSVGSESTTPPALN